MQMTNREIYYNEYDPYSLNINVDGSEDGTDGTLAVYAPASRGDDIIVELHLDADKVCQSFVLTREETLHMILVLTNSYNKETNNE